MSIGLTANVGSQVCVGNAERIRTLRIQDPAEMTCPLWTGYDLAGRPACEDSFLSKMEGCNSAEDRISVENTLRPQYTNFVTLSSAGIDASGLYNTTSSYEAGVQAKKRVARSAAFPKFGTVSSMRNKSSDTTEEVKAVISHAQDSNAATAQQSRVRQAQTIGQQQLSRRSAFGGGYIANPSADYSRRSTLGGDYVTLRDYNSGTR